MKFLKNYLTDEKIAEINKLLGDDLVGQIDAKLEGVTINAAEQKFIPKAVFDADKAALKAQISERDKSIETLKASTKDNAELQTKIAELEKTHKESKEKYEAELLASKQNYAFESAIAGLKPKNAKALAALIDKSKITYADDGNGGFTVSGLKEQAEALKKTDGYLFESSGTGTPPPQNPPKPGGGENKKLEECFGIPVDK